LIKFEKKIDLYSTTLKDCEYTNWNECIKWTRERLNEVWLDRGVFPGF
jgi:hypothetical protein